MVRPVERGGQPSLRDGHPDRVPEPLAQRPGGDLDGDAAVPFGMAGRAAAPAPKVLKIIEREVVARQVQQAVEQHAPVSRREHEPVAVGPLRVGGIMPQVAGPQHVGHRRGAHRHAGMARRGPLHRIDAEHADGVDAELVDAPAPGSRGGARYRRMSSVVELSWPSGGATPGADLPHDALGEGLAQLDAPLVEGIDVPDGPLHENAVLIERAPEIPAIAGVSWSARIVVLAGCPRTRGGASIPVFPPPRPPLPFSRMRAPRPARAHSR